jgi:hypothetical protein
MANLFDPSTLYEILNSQKLLPEWAPTLPFSGASGEFYNNTNRLVSNRPDNNLRRNTLSHEMSHAVQTNLMRAVATDIAEKKWNKQELSPQEEQYLKTANTLYNTQFGRVGQFDRRQYDLDNASLENLLKGMFKSRNQDKDYDAYRTQPTEAQAFGVGNMSIPETEDSRARGQHMDPTFATEFSILLDMYKRLPQNIRDSSASRVRDAFDHNRKLANKEPSYRDYEDTVGFQKEYDDPFRAYLHKAEMQMMLKEYKKPRR